MKKITLISIMICFLLTLSSCTKNITIEGNYMFDYKIKQIKNGLTKEEVSNILGPASTTANFHENTWYYMYSKYKQPLKFLDKHLIESKIVVITFKNNNVVNTTILTEKNRKNIPLYKEQTQGTLEKKAIYSQSTLPGDLFTNQTNN